MGIPRSAFVDLKDFNVGDRVRYRSGRYGSGEGTITLIWFGCEEMCDVKRDDGGDVICLCPEFDSITLVEANDGRRNPL